MLAIVCAQACENLHRRFPATHTLTRRVACETILAVAPASAPCWSLSSSPCSQHRPRSITMGNKPQVEKQARKLYVGDRLDVLCSDGVWRGSEVVKLENAKGSEGVTVLTDATMEIVQLDFTNRRHVSRIAGEGKFSKVATVEPPKQRTAPVKVPDGESTDGAGSGSGTTAGAAAATSRLSSSLVNSVPLLSITLEDVMASATLQPFFVVYVEAHFDRDDLHFLLQAQSFKRMLEGPKGGRGAATVAHCVSKARAIAGRFVQLDSLDTVELPLQLRNDILGRLRRQCDANVLRDVFDAAVKEVCGRRGGNLVWGVGRDV